MGFSEEELEFIKTNLNEKVDLLLFNNSAKRFPNFKSLISQISARQKIKDKLPSWYQNLNLIIPASLSVEQSSSEIAANYKAKLLSGNNFVDLTGGMGVDFFAIAKQFSKNTYCEQNADLVEIAKHNSKIFGISNAEFFNVNALDFLTKGEVEFDWIYLDPARRNPAGGKVFSLADCEPNILEIKDIIFEKTKNILLKCSPMLDISLAVNQLKNVAEVHIVAIDNEVKELLFVLRNEVKNQFIKVVHFNKQKTEEFLFNIDEENELSQLISAPQKYIYEPNAGLLKAGAYKSLSHHFTLPKLHSNTHLYTSDKLIDGFPGRAFQLINILKPDRKIVNLNIPSRQANLAVRNFPDSVANLKKKLGLLDGGDHYLFACTNHLNEKIILQTIKIK